MSLKTVKIILVNRFVDVLDIHSVQLSSIHTTLCQHYCALVL